MSPNVRGKSGAIALVVASLACAGISAPAAGEARKLGAYAGTIEASHAHPTLTYRARARVTLPVSERKPARIGAEFLAGEAPPASVLVTQWDTFHRETSADSGGQFNTLSCSLAAPGEIPMTATGVLDVDLKKKTHAMSVALVSTRQLDFDCTHSRSGKHKRKLGISMILGTGVPGMHFETQLPAPDAARLAAKHTLPPTPPGAGGPLAPVVQAWDLKLEP